MTRRALPAAALVAAFLAGCNFSDEVDPADAGIEVIANDEAGAACSMSWEIVPAGPHEFVVITEGSGARVVVRDPDGRAVLRHPDPQAPAGAGEGEGVARQVSLTPGVYTATCTYPDGGSGEAGLVVTP